MAASCTTVKIAPVQPAEQYGAIESIRELSTINIPLTMPVAELQKQINSNVKGLLYETTEAAENNLAIKVWKTETIVLTANDDVIETSIPLKISIKAGLTIRPFGVPIKTTKDIDFQIRMKYLTKVSINTDWSLYSKTTGNGYDWITEPVIKIANFDVPVSFIVGQVLKSQQETIAAGIDEEIQKNFNLKKYAADAWSLFQTPILLSSRFDTWLKFSPQEIIVSPLLCKNNIFSTCLGFTSYIETLTGDKPVILKEQLPPFKKYDNAENNFSIKLLAQVSHANATKIVQQYFAGKEFKFKKDKYTVRLEKIDMYGNGNHLVIKAEVSGSLKGIIFFKGIPYYDAAKKVIALRELDFDLDTKNKLARSANWLKHDAIVQAMDRSFYIPVDEHIVNAKTEINKYLNNYKVSPYASISGKIKDLSPGKISIQPNTFFIQLVATGQLEVKLNGAE